MYKQNINEHIILGKQITDSKFIHKRNKYKIAGFVIATEMIQHGKKPYYSRNILSVKIHNR